MLRGNCRNKIYYWNELLRIANSKPDPKDEMTMRSIRKYEENIAKLKILGGS